MRNLALSLAFVAAVKSGLSRLDARPPQLVAISFDGAGDADMLREWRSATQR